MFTAALPCRQGPVMPAWGRQRSFTTIDDAHVLVVGERLSETDYSGMVSRPEGRAGNIGG
jgi:hypothetical protein